MGKELHTETLSAIEGKCDMKIHGSVVVGTKGQVVIPSEARKLLDIQPGDTLFCLTKYGKAIGLIKMEDLNDFMEYMQQEMEATKATKKV